MRERSVRCQHPGCSVNSWRDDALFSEFSYSADDAADRLRRMALDAERHQFADAGAHDATTATVGP